MIARLFSPFAAKLLLIVVGGLLMMVGLQRCTIDRQAAKISKMAMQVNRSNENHRQTKRVYAAAQRVAAERHAANLARIVVARDAINKRTIDDLQISRRAAVAGLARLRDQARTHAESVAGHPDLAASAEATCRTYAGTSCDQIPTLLGAAQDNTDQLVAFQQWARANLAVPLEPVRD